MRVDKLKYKQVDDIWICPACGVPLPKSLGKMNHLNKCKKV